MFFYLGSRLFDLHFPDFGPGPMGPGPLSGRRDAENPRNAPTPRPNPRPGAEISRSGQPSLGFGMGPLSRRALGLHERKVPEDHGPKIPWARGPWSQGPWAPGPWAQGPWARSPWEGAQGPWAQGPEAHGRIHQPWAGDDF